MDTIAFSLIICIIYIGEPEINIVLTGVMGSGKSAVCNFFFRKEIFKSEYAFKPVTIDTDFRVQMIGGKLTKLVDTPGLLDPSVHTDYEYEKIAKAVLAVPNGIHALGVVIKIGNRITTEDVRILEKLLEFIELVPYTFVIFSNAYMLGRAHDEQQHNLKILLNDSPEILHKLLESIGHRYIILESVLNKEQGYYDTKVDELMKIVKSILDKQKKPFTCFLNHIARELLQSNASQKKRIDDLKRDFKKSKARGTEEYKKVQGRLFWRTFLVLIGGSTGAAVGAAAGTLLGPLGSAAGSTAGASLGASAVAAIVGTAAGGTVVGGATGYSIETGINKCRNQ